MAYMRTSDAVSSAPGLRFGLYVLLVVYALMTVATVYVLRRLARRPLPVAPQEPDVVEEKVDVTARRRSSLAVIGSG